MVLLRTSYMYGDFLEYYFRLQFSAFWSMHDKTSSWENANYKMYPPPPPPPNNWITSRKKVNPPATTWKISNILTRNSSHWEYLNPMRNLELLEKYQPPPPPSKRRKSQSTRKRKNIAPCKSFNHPKIASTIMKKPQTPTWKILNFSKKPNSIGKIFHSFEVTRPIKPYPPMRKSQFLKI